jgi:hypothetical protein
MTDFNPPDDPGRFNLGEGEARKDAGMSLVSANNAEWHANAFLLAMSHAPWGKAFLFEIIHGIPDIGVPKHPGAWGALANALVKAKVIRPATAEEDGGYVKSHSKRNHAHKYQLYVRVGNGGGNA